MKITDAIINPRTLGKKLILVDIQPMYEYDNGRRTDTIKGYRYVVALPEHGFDKISVKIEGHQRVEKPDNYIEVTFEGLELFIYWMNGNYELGARATSINCTSAKSNA